MLLCVNHAHLIWIYKERLNVNHVELDMWLPLTNLHASNLRIVKVEFQEENASNAYLNVQISNALWIQEVMSFAQDVLQVKCSLMDDVKENVQQVFTLITRLQLARLAVQTVSNVMMETLALFARLTLQWRIQKIVSLSVLMDSTESRLLMEHIAYLVMTLVRHAQDLSQMNAHLVNRIRCSHKISMDQMKLIF